MTPEQLKSSILLMAIQGKIVEQREEEGSGEDLYDLIQKEKLELISTGDIRQTTLDAITEEEIPFDIPSSWKWVKHNDLFEIVGGSQPPKSNFKDIPDEGDVRLYQIRDYGDTPVPVYVDRNLVSKFTEEGDILLARYGGSLGKVFWAKEGAYNVAMAKIVMLYKTELVDRSYLYYYYLAPLYQNLVKGSNRAAQGGFNKDDLNALMFPLPPLEEQHRIVTKIEELLPYVDRYAEAYEKLEKFNAKFPEDMKKSILQYAIQGKLVDQRPEEGTAEELYQQIQKEKQKLIKEGKIKKEKPLAEITEDEIPFDIPESWKWCYIGELFLHNTGKAQNASGSQNGVVRKFITTSNLYWNLFDFTKVKEMPFTVQELERCTVKKGDLLVCEGGDCGRSAVWNYDEEVCIQNHVHRLRPYKELDIYYFYYIFYLYKNTGRLRGRGVAIQGLSNEAIHRVLIPLPPLEEQHRIVAKIEELLPYCDRLL